MKEQAEQLFWVHDRGLFVTLPPVSTEIIGHAVANEEPICDTESRRLEIVANDSILKKRHPHQNDGETYMQGVDNERRLKLLSLAQELTSHAVAQWQNINPSKDIAVLLYGSVAKSLVKEVTHESPSDIDLTIIGDFTDRERAQMRDSIQEKREEVREHVLADCPMASDIDRQDIRYAGTLVQDIDKLTKNGYSGAIRYIGSCARPLYDPAGIWESIEQQALEYVAPEPIKKKRRMQPNTDFYILPKHSSSQVLTGNA